MSVFSRLCDACEVLFQVLQLLTVNSISTFTPHTVTFSLNLKKTEIAAAYLGILGYCSIVIKLSKSVWQCTKILSSQIIIIFWEGAQYPSHTPFSVEEPYPFLCWGGGLPFPNLTPSTPSASRASSPKSGYGRLWHACIVINNVR